MTSPDSLPENLSSSALFSEDTERRIYELMQYGFWTAAAGVAMALGFAVLLYGLTDLGTLSAAGCAVGASLVAMLSARLVRLRGLADTTWQEWLFIVIASTGVTGLVAVLERVLP